MKAVCAVFLMFFCAVSVGAVPVPILMYHDFVSDDTPCGEYAVNEAELRSHLDALTESGYESVTFAELIGYADGKNDLPESPVLITADDGYTGVVDIAVPLLGEYGMKLSCAVIGGMAGDGVHFSLEEDTPDCLELVSHTYGLHRLVGNACGVLAADEDELRRDISLMRGLSEVYPMIGEVFVYPYGAYSAESEAFFADCGYRVTVTCDRGCAEVVRGGELYALPRIGVWHGMSGDDVVRAIERYK